MKDNDMMWRVNPPLDSKVGSESNVLNCTTSFGLLFVAAFGPSSSTHRQNGSPGPLRLVSSPRHAASSPMSDVAVRISHAVPTRKSPHLYIPPNTPVLAILRVRSCLSRSMDGGEIGRCRKKNDDGEGGAAVEEERNPAMVSGWDEECEEVEVEEAAVAEVMRLLEREISSPSGNYYQAPAFVTINGNEETCGPSFSDSTSTVMASIDTRGLVGSGERLPDLERPAGGEEEEESEEAWLARVIGGAGFVLEEGLL